MEMQNLPPEYQRIYRLKKIADSIVGETEIAELTKVLFEDPDPVVRHEAGFSMGEIGTPLAAKALIKAMQTDPAPIVRHECAEALGWIKTEDSRKALEKAMKEDADEIVRSTARISLDIHDNPRDKYF